MNGKTESGTLEPLEPRLLLAAVEGQLFRDLNADGLHDPGEGGLNGWTIEIEDVVNGHLWYTSTADVDLDDNGQIDPDTESGRWSFEWLSPGSYEVRQFAPDGWLQTLPDTPAYTFDHTTGQELTGLDFGNWTAPSDVRGQVYEDLDGDGLRDPYEPAMNGWTVELVDVDTGTVIDSQVTADVDTESGVYSFTGLDPTRRNEIRVVPQAGWAQTRPLNAGPGAAGLDFLVNTQTDYTQEYPDVAGDAAGNYVVVWQSDTVYAEKDRDIFAQRYHADGTPNGEEFRVNTYTTDHQEHPRVAMNAGGEFVVVWESEDQDGDSAGAFAQRYHADGTANGGEFQVNPVGAGYQVRPAVAMDDTGRFLATWTASDGSGAGAFAQRFDAAGSAVGEAFQVNPLTSGNQWFALVAVNGAGQAIITWQSDDVDGSGDGVYARLFHVDGSPHGAEFRIGEIENWRGEQMSSVAMDPTGRFVVAWNDNREYWDASQQQGHSEGVYARRFHADGTADGEELHVNTYTDGDQKSPDVAMDPSGRFVITWEGYGQGRSTSGIYGQMFGPDGVPNGQEFPVDTRTHFTQVDTAVAISSAGGIVSVWASGGLDGQPGGSQSTGIGARLLPGFRDDGVFWPVLTPGEETSGLDFGHFAAATVAGQKFEDLNTNGQRDASEEGLDGWRIEFVDADTDQVVDATVTASEDLNGNGTIDPLTETGLYSFPAVVPGEYVLREVLQDGWAATPPAAGSYALTLNQGDALTGVDFGNARDSVLGGRKFEDLNGNGTRDPGEVGLDGWTIQLVDPATEEVLGEQVTAGVDLDDNGQIDPETEAGLYRFTGLLPGEYQLREVAQDGWTQTLPAAPMYSVTLGYNADRLDLDFGNQPAPGEIHGQKFEDLNADGVHDPNEPGLDGWTIELVDPDTGAVLATRVTTSTDLDGNGQIDPETESGLYSFAGLARGEYIVREVPQAGWRSIVPSPLAAVTVDPLIQVNVLANSDEWDPDVAVADDGGFVVAWRSERYGDREVFARCFLPDGTGRGPEFPVETAGDRSEHAAVTIGPGGDFVVAWQSSGSDLDIRARRYYADGTPKGDDFVVNTYVTNTQRWPDIASTADGGFVVVWDSAGQDGDGHGVYGQRYGPDGVPVGGEFRINETTEGTQVQAVVGTDSAGGFVVAWGSHDLEWAAYARRYRPDGTPAGGELVVDAGTDNDWRTPTDIIVAPNGTFTVLWERQGQEYARCFYADGTPAGDAFLSESRDLAGLTPPMAAWLDAGNNQVLTSTGWPGAPSLLDSDLHTAVVVTAADSSVGIQAQQLHFGPPGHSIFLAAGQVHAGTDFANYRPARVSGRTFEDRNLNGVWDTDEPALNGWAVQLVDAASGGVVGERVTADLDVNDDGQIDPLTESGWYAFEDLLPGDYHVRMVVEPRWLQTHPVTGQHDLSLISGSDKTAIHFGFAHGGVITGQKFEDINGDGVRDTGEPGLDGWTIELLNADTGEALATQTTASVDLDDDGQIDLPTEAGWYTFDLLLPNRYELREAVQAGWGQTFPMSGGHTVDLAYAQEAAGRDFGNHRPAGDLLGQKFHDTNADGLRDVGEIGLDGWTIELVDPETGNVVDTVATASIDLDGDGQIDPEREAGLYAFSGVERGRELQVRESPQPGWVQTHPATENGFGWPGSEFQVNTYTAGNQRDPVVATNAAGKSVIAWMSNDQDGNSNGVYAQRYHPDGTPNGGEFLVNTYTDGGQSGPVVAVNDAGEFVVGWQSFAQDGDGYGVYAQMYHADGTPNGGELHVDTVTIGWQIYPSAAIDPFGRVIVAWHREDPPEQGGHSDIYARRYDPNAVAETDPFRVNTHTPASQTTPAVAVDGAGAFVVVWDSYLQDANGHGIYAQRYTAHAAPDGEEFNVSLWGTNPSVAMSDGGRFLAAWEAADSHRTGVFARYYDPDGTPRDDAFQVNAHTQGYQTDPDVAMDARGCAVISWSSSQSSDPDTNKSDIFARVYHPDGTPRSGEIPVNRHTLDYQTNPTVAIDDSSRVVAAWESAGQDGSDDGIFARRFEAGAAYDVVVLSGQTVDNLDFGNYHAAVVSGQVFEDLNVDAEHDAGEPGINGWVVELVEAEGDEIFARRVTAGVDLNDDGSIDPQTEAGLYSFQVDQPGDYEVRLLARSGWVTTATPPVMQLGDSDVVAEADFAVARTGAIRGRKFEDLDGNGQDDAGEPALGGWTIELLDTDIGEVVATATTTEAGLYAFEDLLLGNYEVREVLQEGWAQTAPATGTWTETLAYAQEFSGRDFGNQAIPSEIHGQKFHDANANGIRDAGEVGLDGWTIELVDPATTEVLATQVTTSVDLDDDQQIDPETEPGLYAFTGLGRGEYLVREVQQDGWGQSAPALPDIGYGAEDFQVNVPSSGSQRRPDVAVGQDGQTVVVWKEYSTRDGIFARIYDAEGTLVGNEVRVDDGADDSDEPAVAIHGSGRFVVTWFADGYDSSHYGIKARLYDAAGSPLTDVLLVSAPPDANEKLPDVAFDPDGGFLITWQQWPSSSDFHNVYARRYDVGGTPLGGAFQVNSTPNPITSYMQDAAPCIAVDAAGGFAIAWSTRPSGTGPWQVHARCFRPDGTPVGPQFQADSAGLTTHEAAIAMDASGDFVLVWMAEQFDGDESGIAARRFHPDGTPIGPEIIVNETTDGYQMDPSVAVDAMGQFVVVWHSPYLDEPGHGVFGRKFNPDGSPVDGQFPVSTQLVYPGATNIIYQVSPSVGMNGSGDFAVSWHWRSTGGGDIHIMARQFHADRHHTVALAPGGDQTGVDLGNYRPASVSGQLFHDANDNSVRDAGETGLDDWIVQLIGPDGELLSARLTGSVDLDGNGQIDPETESGLYVLGDVAPGDYTIEAVLHPLWVARSPADGKHPVSLADGQHVEGLDFAASFVPAPRVVSSSIQDGDALSGAELVYTAAFDQELATDEFDRDDFVLVAADGGRWYPDEWGYDSGTSTLTATYSGLADGGYTLTLLSGDGRFENVYGWDLDGEPPGGTIPPEVSGDGVEGGDFAVAFSWDNDVAPMPRPMETVLPFGGMIYQATVAGRIDPADDTDTFTFEPDVGQTLAVAVEAEGSLRVRVELRDPDDDVVAQAEADTAGGRVVLPAQAAGLAGEYRIAVRSLDATTGGYTLRMLLNAEAEVEAHGDAANNELADAQDLDDAFVGLLGDGQAGERAALVARADGRGTFSRTWTSDDVLAWPDELVVQADRLHQAAGAGLIRLAVRADLAHESEYIDVHADGLYAGRLFAETAELDVYTAEIGLTENQLAALTADGEIAIRLVPSYAVDDFGAGEVEVSLEYVSLAETPDYASFHLDAGQPAALTLAALTDGVLQLDLLDADGVVLAMGTPDATDLGWVITHFVAPADGEYYVRVAGADTTDYSLLIARDAQLSVEPHDTFETAQDITPTGVAAGVAGFDMARLFAVDTAAGHNDVVEIDPQTGQVLWTFSPAVGPLTGLATTPTTLLAASAADGRIYELDLDDGAILRTLDSPGISPGELGFYGAEIFVRTGDQLIVLDYATGAVKRTVLPEFAGGAVGSSRGLVALQDGSLAIADPVTGRTQFTAGSGLGDGATGIVRDELFVASGDCIEVFDLATLSPVRSMEVAGLELSDLGADTSFGQDYYAFAAEAGDALTIRTETPSIGPAGFENYADPVIELYAPDGSLLAVADNNDPDGRDGHLTFQTAQTGLHRVRIFDAGVGGQYVLSVAIDGSAAARSGGQINPTAGQVAPAAQGDGPTEPPMASEPIVFGRLADVAGPVFAAHAAGAIDAPGGSASFAVTLDAGQVVTAMATPDDSLSTLALELVGLAGPVAAAAPGEPAVLQATSVATAGQYELRITGDLAATFVLDVFGNATIEHADTADAGEAGLDAGLIDLSGGGWAAVVGRSDPRVTVDEYTLDLSAFAGTPVDIALIGLSGSDMADVRVDLLLPDGTSVSACSLHSPVADGSGGFHQVIGGSLLPAAGVYTLRVSGRTSGQYAMFVSAERVLDVEPNDSPADPLRSLDGTHGAVGLLASSADVDRYAVTLSAGQGIHVATETPFDLAGGDLDPALVIYDPSGVPVAWDEDSAPDARNADLDFEAPVDGVYVVEVSSQSGGGDYLLTTGAASRPAIQVRDSSGDPTDRHIQFITPLSQFRAGAQDVPLVRPAWPDAQQFIDVTNTGTGLLRVREIQIAAPDVAVTATLTDDIVLAPGETQTFQLTYAPSLPTSNDATCDDFDLTDGLILLSNAVNAPVLPVALEGHSTFNSDISHDGYVNLAELGPMNANFGRKRGDSNWDPTADINGDGAVNLGDLGLLNREFGRERSAVPQTPGTESSGPLGAKDSRTAPALAGIYVHPETVESEQADTNTSSQLLVAETAPEDPVAAYYKHLAVTAEALSTDGTARSEGLPLIELAAGDTQTYELQKGDVLATVTAETDVTSEGGYRTSLPGDPVDDPEAIDWIPVMVDSLDCRWALISADAFAGLPFSD